MQIPIDKANRDIERENEEQTRRAASSGGQVYNSLHLEGGLHCIA